MRIAVLCLTLQAFVWVTQLSPEIQVDRYLLRAERQIKGRDFTGAKRSLDRLRELQAQHGIEIPEDFSLKYAQVSLGLGFYAEAIESATRYLTLAGRDGKHYRAALELLDKAEAEMAAVEAAKNRLEEKRKRLRDAIVGMEFVRIPAGEFLMGSRRKPGESVARAEPVTRVRISRPFDLGKYEVTQEQWEAIMGSNPSHQAGCMDCPVEEVSWDDVQNFIRRLKRLSKTHSDGAEYRLPTEAEWEYAARAGTTGDSYAGDVPRILGGEKNPILERISWYPMNSGRRTHPVGQKEPNPWGLHDMLGNVSEWVQDWFEEYPGEYVTDHVADHRSGKFRRLRIDRGGDFINGRFRVWQRPAFDPEQAYFTRGFRFVRIVP